MKKVGEITADECKEIDDLYEKIKALKNLELVQMSEVLKSKTKQDIQKLQYDFDLWWENKAKKYQWEMINNGHWIVNFSTNEIFLTENNII